MHELINIFRDKKNLRNLLILLILALGLPFAINLARQAQIFKSRAENPPIQFSGSNVDNKQDIPVLKPIKTNPNCTAFCDIKYQVDIQLDPGTVASPQPGQ